MKEEFLHYIWKYQLQTDPLYLIGGNIVEIINPGTHNKDAGPDFFNAKIKIGDTIWAGNIEIHIKASDWYKHKHEIDPAYDNIILHIVAQNDKIIKRQNGTDIPTLELKIPKQIYNQYILLTQNKNWLPCETFISKIDDFTLLQWKETLLIERLENKTENIKILLKKNNSNWEETFYQSLASNFGFKINSLPFELLAKSLPVKCLGKHKDQLPLIEAMLFGQSGLLPETTKNNYIINLQKDYKHLALKFGLEPINKSLWKFMRLRPANFPTLRIAQFATLIHKSNKLFSNIIETDNIKNLSKLFEIQASEFWDTHYSFKKESPKKTKNLGEIAFQNLVINTIVPTLFLFGKQKNEQKLVNKSIEWLNQIAPEQNNIIKKWQDLGIKTDNAFDTQALIQLKNVYCKNKKCLNCRIGNQVIRYFV